MISRKIFSEIRNFLFLMTLPLGVTGCQMNYYFSSAYHQMKLLSSREPIEEVLKKTTLTENERHKLELAQKARVFAETELHLKASKNYTTYVQLDRPSVTYVVSAAPKWELKHYLWSFPFVGSVPYKGFFSEKEAQSEESSLQSEDLDTYLRGVSAYSTLGWFNDPLLSSMLTYSDHDLVNTIIHETVHATLYIKSSADFNERMAVFIGNKGMELFYKKFEGENSPTLTKVRLENADDRVFSQFISEEISQLELWYRQQKTEERLEERRQSRIQEIQKKFERDVAPRLQSKSYSLFPQLKLNNARLLVYKTYLEDLSDFEKLFEKENHDFSAFLKACQSLEDSKSPAEDLKKLTSN